MNMQNRDMYESPFINRYGGKEMQKIFSQDMKFKTWRKLWIALAEAEMELGLPITQDQIDEMIKFQEDINHEEAEKKEKEIRHDVMAHIHAYGAQCTSAKGIIHLGATSCYVGDNTDIILMIEAMKLIRNKIILLLREMKAFANKYKGLPTLGFTHFQPAQLVTVGKRATLWMNELVMDLEDIEYMIGTIKLLGSKGTTGTQASFLSLFNGDRKKVNKLEQLIADKMGFDSVYPVSGQTYSRKVDSRVLNVLSGVAQSAYKFANDIRLLQSMKEIEEPFEKDQIGSSAMAYKRNPMRSERICAIARYVILNSLNPAMTTANQWFERSLDDSANKRIAIPEAFLAIDAILNLYINIASGLVVYPKVIEKHIAEELPFMATENILMECVKKGGDRQELHEKIRVHSMAAGNRVKTEGKENDLIERIKNDKAFDKIADELGVILDPKNFVGCAPEQVDEYLSNYIEPIIEKHRHIENKVDELNV